MSMDARSVRTHLFATILIEINVIANLVSQNLAKQATSGIVTYVFVSQNV